MGKATAEERIMVGGATAKGRTRPRQLHGEAQSRTKWVGFSVLE